MTHLTLAKDQHYRNVLFKRDPHCHWCGQKTFESRECGDGHPWMATLDHIKSRLQCATKEEYRSGKNKVLACLKCNKERDYALLKRLRCFKREPVTVPPELDGAFPQ